MAEKKSGKSEKASEKPSVKPSEKAAARPQATVWQRAMHRWIAITSVMAALLALYTQHPYYRNQQFTAFKTIYPPAFFLWVVFGVFYCKATIEKFHERRYTMRDGGLHLIMLFRAYQRGRFWRIAKNRRVRTTLLAIIVKAYYIPLMTGFFVGHIDAITRAWLNHKHLPAMQFTVPNGASIFAAFDLWWKNVGVRLHDLVPAAHDVAGWLQPWNWTRDEFSWGLGIFYDVIFAVDCGWAVIGYSSESRWLGNKTRSVEPTAFGWAVTLAWYPPFNNVTGTYLPLVNGPQIITSADANLALRAIIVFLFTIYASATVAFGLKFSNLTNRGIVSRGPYRFVRHPAYLCKCTAWWLEHLPTMTLTKALFLSVTCFVYGLRAYTEERHLGMDPEYQAYKKKVPWVIFPGVY